MSSHGSHRSVILVLFFLYFGSTGIPSDIKLCLTTGSTNWNDFSSRTTITFAENPDFEIWLKLNSPYEFSTAYSTNNRADSLHRKLLSYLQNRSDAKIYSIEKVSVRCLRWPLHFVLVKTSQFSWNFGPRFYSTYRQKQFAVCYFECGCIVLLSYV